MRNFELPGRSLAVTVPGAVDAWCRLVADHGRLPMSEVLAPAIAMARQGYAITPRVPGRHAHGGSAFVMAGQEERFCGKHDPGRLPCHGG